VKVGAVLRRGWEGQQSPNLGLAPPKCDMKHCLMNSKHRYIGTKSILWPSKCVSSWSSAPDISVNVSVMSVCYVRLSVCYVCLSRLFVHLSRLYVYHICLSVCCVRLSVCHVSITLPRPPSRLGRGRLISLKTLSDQFTRVQFWFKTTWLSQGMIKWVTITMPTK